MNRIFDFLMNVDDESKAMFSQDVASLIMDMYYTKYWEDNSMSFERSGANLHTEINQLKPEAVLDVGCGNNNFKDSVYNLVGIDPFNKKADHIKTIDQYFVENPDKEFDVVLVLDSMNFVRKADILHRFELINKHTKKGGYQFWRVNKGVEESDAFPLVGLLDSYEWDEKFVNELAEYNGFEVKEICEETNAVGEKRLFFCFYKY